MEVNTFSPLPCSSWDRPRRAGWANAHTRPQSASASQTACYKWKKIGARAVPTSFDLWGRGSDVASILSGGSPRQTTTETRGENPVLRWWRKGSEQLSLYLPANSEDHFMPTVLWSSEGAERSSPRAKTKGSKHGGGRQRVVPQTPPGQAPPPLGHAALRWVRARGS